MRFSCKRGFFVLVLLALPGVGGLSAQPYPQPTDTATFEWATIAGYRIRSYPNITYKTAGGVEVKLDVYAPSKQPPGPTLIYIHGGGWVGLSKEYATPYVMQYLAMGMRVVNVAYRLAPVALAPAAVEDCRCALRWVYAHAEEYGFDVKRLVVAGHSAGGHLALITGLLDSSAGFDNECPGDSEVPVAAIINFYGVADVAAMLPVKPFFALRWIGYRTDRVELARQLSPLSYIRPGVPPVLTIHGLVDEIVPHQQAILLKEALDKVGIANELISMEGRGHGNFTDEEFLMIHHRIQDFLRVHGILPRKSSPPEEP